VLEAHPHALRFELLRAALLLHLKRYGECMACCQGIIARHPTEQRAAYHILAEALLAVRGVESLRRALRALIAAATDQVHEVGE
jgi:hypothetical protein